MVRFALCLECDNHNRVYLGGDVDLHKNMARRIGEVPRFCFCLFDGDDDEMGECLFVLN